MPHVLPAGATRLRRPHPRAPSPPDGHPSPSVQVLKSPALQAKARLLKRRAKGICAEMDDEWWARVVEAQRKLTDHWEVHYVDAGRGKAFWCNWVTEETRWTKPPETAALA